MSSFQANSYEYNITTENEVASVLSHFNTDFIIDIIRQNILNKDRTMFLPMANIVTSYEQNFKDIAVRYPGEIQQISSVRLKTYAEIIDELCHYYNLQFNDNGELDYYSAAFYLYDFLVSNFSSHMCFFFANYIYRERNSIYDAMHLNDLKKNKDTSTTYGKKVYKDVRLAVINANIDRVIANMETFDIPLSTILSIIYPDKSVVNYIMQIISPIYDFYNSIYVPCMNKDTRPILITNIRLLIQQMSIDPNANNFIGGINNVE